MERRIKEVEEELGRKGRGGDDGIRNVKKRRER